MDANGRMTAANLQQTAASPAPNGRSKNLGGGQLSKEFPHRLHGWIDEELHNAIKAAAAYEKEREATVIRRWLRFAARQAGLIK